MSRNKFKVETANNGQTPKNEIKHPFIYKELNTVEKTNVPTGKVKTAEDTKRRRQERENKYKNFRINALLRRAARLNLPEEKVQELVEKLREQLDAPKLYIILIMYNKNNAKMIEEIMLNNNIGWLMKSNEHMYVEGDMEFLNKIRELMPEGTKIHPYTKKLPPILKPTEPPKCRTKTLTKAAKKKAASEAKKARKQALIEQHLNHKEHAKIRKAEHNKKKRTEEKHKKLFEKKLTKKAKTVSMKTSKDSKVLKKAA